MKKTKLQAFFVVAIIACLTLGITACGGEKESPAKDFVTYEVNGEVMISGYKSQTPDIIVPKKIKGKPVTTISDGAFNGLKNVTSIKLHDGIKKIGTGSFAGCEKITSIVVPEGITEIGDNTFRDCEKLESITLPSTVKTIGKNAFKACKSLKEIKIPDGVESIGEAAFLDCNTLSKVYLPASVTSIGLQAFFNIENLEITMEPTSSFCVTRMNKDFTIKLIGNCTQDQIYDLNKNMKILSKTSKNISVALDMKDVTGLDILEQASFGSNISLISISLPNSIKKIDEGAFAGCVNLRDIVLSDGLLEIGECAFIECKSLEGISIPASVVAIGQEAFEFSGIKTVNYHGSKDQLKLGFDAFPEEVTINYNYSGE